MNDDNVWFDQGGGLPAAVTEVRLERVRQCPNGHWQFRLNGSGWLEHLIPKDDPDAIRCPHSVEWDPGVTLIDTAMAAHVLNVTTRRVQQLIAQGVLTNHGDARQIRLDLEEVSAHAARRHRGD